MTKKIKVDKVYCLCKKPECCLASYRDLDILKNKLEVHGELADCPCKSCSVSNSITGGGESSQEIRYINPFNKHACQLAEIVLINNMIMKNLLVYNRDYHLKHIKLTKKTDEQAGAICKLKTLNIQLLETLKTLVNDVKRHEEENKNKSTRIKRLKNTVKNNQKEMSKMVYKTENDDKFIDIKEGENMEIEDDNNDNDNDNNDNDNNDNDNNDNDKNDNVGMVYKYERLKNYMVSQRRSLGDVLKSNSKVVINELVNRFFKVQNIRNVLSHPVIKDIDIITNDKDFTSILTTN